MSTRPRRTTSNQKDSSNDMLGLSREEERMLQRAMYDSLRQPNKFKFKHFRKSQFLKKSMTTRSMAVTKLTVSVEDIGVQESIELTSLGDCFTPLDESKVEQEIKRGTRYSPMRKGPLSEMLKSLENKKTQIDIMPSLVLVRPLSKKNIQLLKKKEDCMREIDPSLSIKSPKVVLESLDLKRPGRPRLIRNEIKRCRMSSPKSKTPTRLSAKSPSNTKVNQRTPRSASLAARSYWLSQVSDTSSPNRVQPKGSVSVTSPTSEVKPTKSSPKREEKESKPLVYNRKALSNTQRMSRTILATAAKRAKKAKLKSDVADNCRRNSSKSQRAKESEVQNSLIIPPELWLDPKGQPVDTQDFINFLLYRDTPYLESSLKWFHLPPNRRKQRFYKVIQSEPGIKFNETVVYTEKKEGGGKEVVVHCIPPKLVDEGSELVSSTSDKSSVPGITKVKLSTSCDSSCHTHAAVDEEPLMIVSENNNLKQSIEKCSPGPGRPKVISAKVSPAYEYRSKHIMQTRKRGA